MEKVKMLTDHTVQHIQDVWPSIMDVLHVPHNDDDYEQLVQVLDHLIEQSRGDETHPLSSLKELIGVLVEDYETGHPDFDWELR